ncbi:MAG: 16S rRNA (guanine(527)-N(7))-methyltransferase RsmG [Deltaproteobacteria bacterium]|nr:16S rRNA (guanine(527)-N(7))-methyltransferase RsmG [Deltaproteobacteria bacterium]
MQRITVDPSLIRTVSDAAQAIGVPLGHRELALIETYHRELLLWNEKINLVSVKSALDIPIKHVIDSLTIAPFITNRYAKVLDIGAGAGFPGIPLKIVRNELHVFLLEASRKKSSFLKHIIRSLNLAGTIVIHDRAERLMQGESYREYFDTVISRATLKLPVLIRMGAHFLNPNGFLIAMKGKNPDAELNDAENLPERAVFPSVSIHEIRLPVTGDFRKIVIYKKLS